MSHAYPASGPVKLEANVGDHPVTRALKAGEIRSDLITFDFCGPKVANQGFKPMVREGKFDTGELAIVTFLMAKLYGKPLIILPATVLGRFQQHTIVYNAEHGPLKPGDLNGKRVGLRSYSVTTATWVRGILQHEYGVDPARVTWVCSDDAHLAEYRDPPNVERTPPGAKPFDQMLLAGEIDAAVIPDTPKDPRIQPLIPDPHAAARAWYAKHGIIPINHLIAVQKPLADARPDIVREVYRLFSESKKAAPPAADGIDFFPFGIEANRKPVETIVQFCVEQKIIPRPYSVDEIFGEGMRLLGAAA
jgi:4,5-dihydroxyphthalate decarboxylase